MGTLIPGMARGMLPNMMPRNIPTNSVTMLGSWRRFVELPSFSARRLMSSIRPTTVRRSPICNSRLGLARRSRPARFTRVAFNRYPILRRRLPILRPLNSGRVTSIRRETTGAGIASQFISTGRPINASNALSSCKERTTRSKSPSWSVVSELGMITSSLCLIRDTTKLRSISLVKSSRVLPKISLFSTL